MPTHGCVGECCAPGCGRRQEGIVTGWSSLPVTPHSGAEGYSTPTLLICVALATCQARVHAGAPLKTPVLVAGGCATTGPGSCLLSMLHALCGVLCGPTLHDGGVRCSGSALPVVTTCFPHPSRMSHQRRRFRHSRGVCAWPVSMGWGACLLYAVHCAPQQRLAGDRQRPCTATAFTL